MLIPRFSLRLLIGVTTICGVFFLVVLQATRGQAWAIASSVAVGAWVLTALVHGVIFVAAWALAAVGARALRRPVSRSPFATAGPPPQIVPPSDVE